MMFTVHEIKFSLLTNAVKILPDLALPTSVISLLKMLPHHIGLLTMEIPSLFLPEGLNISVLSVRNVFTSELYLFGLF